MTTKFWVKFIISMMTMLTAGCSQTVIREIDKSWCERYPPIKVSVKDTAPTKRAVLLFDMKRDLDCKAANKATEKGK